MLFCGPPGDREAAGEHGGHVFRGGGECALPSWDRGRGGGGGGGAEGDARGPGGAAPAGAEEVKAWAWVPRASVVSVGPGWARARCARDHFVPQDAARLPSALIGWFPAGLERFLGLQCHRAHVCRVFGSWTQLKLICHPPHISVSISVSSRWIVGLFKVKC